MLTFFLLHLSFFLCAYILLLPSALLSPFCPKLTLCHNYLVWLLMSLTAFVAADYRKPEVALVLLLLRASNHRWRSHRNPPARHCATTGTLLSCGAVVWLGGYIVTSGVIVIKAGFPSLFAVRWDLFLCAGRAFSVCVSVDDVGWGNAFSVFLFYVLCFVRLSTQR